MFSSVRDRIAASTGAAYVVLVLVGNQLNVAGTQQSGQPSGAQVLADASHQAATPLATVGYVLEVLGFVALMAFVGYLLDVLVRRSGADLPDAFAGTTIVAGIIGMAIKLGSAVPATLVASDRESLTPDLARLLNDMGTVGFVLSWAPFAIFVAAAGLALQRAGLVGRPTAYVGAAIGVAGVVLTLIGLARPYDANPAAFMLGLVWILVVSVRLAVRPGVGSRGRGSESAPAPSVMLGV